MKPTFLILWVSSADELSGSRMLVLPFYALALLWPIDGLGRILSTFFIYLGSSRAPNFVVPLYFFLEFLHGWHL